MASEKKPSLKNDCEHARNSSSAPFPGSPGPKPQETDLSPIGRLVIILSTGFGIGYSPVFPGTLGAALGVGIYYLLACLGSLNLTVPLTSVDLFLAGVHLSSAAERHFQRKDPGAVVIDETASFPLTMLLISPTLPRVIVAFALNRVLDIVKPFPIHRIQKLKAGWGIMLDDTAAAIVANLLLRLVILLFKL
jgi:phosphatidylglycerophosphatase A